METTNRMTCEQALQELFSYLDRALAGERLEALEAHLQECLDCCDRLQFSRQVDSFVKARVLQTPVSGDIEARLRRKLAEVLPAASGSSEET